MPGPARAAGRPGGQRGQGLVEYALIVLLVAVVVVVALGTVSTSLLPIFDTIKNALVT